MVKDKKKKLWILYLILSIVVIVCLYLTIKNGAYLIIFSPLLFLIILYIFLYKSASENITIRGAIVGGIIGWIWGIISFFLGIALLERDITFIKILVVLPFYLSRTIFKSELLFVSFTPIIGVFIVGFMVFVIKKIKERIK